MRSPNNLIVSTLLASLVAIQSVLGLTQQTSPNKDQTTGGTQRVNRTESSLSKGDLAPEFDLKKLHSEERLRLSAFKEKKPVALVFGSYT